MRILVLSLEVWRDDQNGGNVLSNLFSGMDAEFAQVYCSDGIPKNDICKKYYQVTDFDIIHYLKSKKKIGRSFYLEDYKENMDSCKSEEKLSFFKKHRWNIFLLGRELLWKMANPFNRDLEDFIIDFSPDIIFAPCYASHYMIHLTEFVSEILHKPIISYISDDNYSLKMFSLDPSFWANRFALRHNLRKVFKKYDLLYTMTDEQKFELEKVVPCEIKVLRKCGEFKRVSKNINSPIRFIYAGGIYLNREKTLYHLAKEIKRINQLGKRFQLDIYTNGNMKSKYFKLLNDGTNSKVHNVVSLKKLKEIYMDSDIALHLESFDIKNRLFTRLSFSTKIVDCLDSSCAVMAICWKNQAGFKYLKENDAAICINNISNIKDALEMIDKNPNILVEYANKAFMLGIRNHNEKTIKRQILNDFKLKANK